jgi:hypothetical protein
MDIFRLTIRLIVRDIRYMFIAGSRNLRLLFSWPFFGVYKSRGKKGSREGLRVPIMELIEPRVLRKLVQMYGLKLEPRKPQKRDKISYYGFMDYEKLMRHDSYCRERGAVKQRRWS